MQNLCLIEEIADGRKSHLRWSYLYDDYTTGIEESDSGVRDLPLTKITSWSGASILNLLRLVTRLSGSVDRSWISTDMIAGLWGTSLFGLGVFGSCTRSCSP